MSLYAHAVYTCMYYIYLLCINFATISFKRWSCDNGIIPLGMDVISNLGNPGPKKPPRYMDKWNCCKLNGKQIYVNETSFAYQEHAGVAKIMKCKMSPPRLITLLPICRPLYKTTVVLNTYKAAFYVVNLKKKKDDYRDKIISPAFL